MPCTQQEHSAGGLERITGKVVFQELLLHNPPDTLLKCLNDDSSLSFSPVLLQRWTKIWLFLPRLKSAKQLTRRTNTLLKVTLSILQLYTVFLFPAVIFEKSLTKQTCNNLTCCVTASIIVIDSLKKVSKTKSRLRKRWD